MEPRSFPTIEDRIAPVMWDLYQSILLENLKEEVRKSNDSGKYQLWLKAIDNDDDFVFENKEDYPTVSGGFDTGWNQRGKMRNSPSGQSFLCGMHTRLPIAGELKSKVCSQCTAWKKTIIKKNLPTDAPVPDHCCLKNHEGSSGSMEPVACVDIVKKLHYNFYLNVKMLVMDDDASSRQAVRWSNEDWLKANPGKKLPQVKKKVGKNEGELKDRPDKGHLPGVIPEPLCVADPNHRRKQLTGELMDLEKKLVGDKHTMTKMDTKRIGKNFSYFVRSLPKMDKSKRSTAAQAIVEHHFDNHEFCGAWCRRRLLTDKQRKESGRYYRSKDNKDDAMLYQDILKVVQGFITPERLEEVAHGMDTNANESINNLITYFAPKNGVYATTRSLQNRIGIAIGVLSLGFKAHFVRLFKALGIAITPNVDHYLEVKDRKRAKRLAKIRLNTQKALRMKTKFNMCRDLEKKAKVAFEKREGTYQPGGNLTGFDEDRTNAPRPKRKKKPTAMCPLCNKKGHSTKRSKQCLFNEKNPGYDPNRVVPGDNAVPTSLNTDLAEKAPSAGPQQDEMELIDADDADNMDTLPFDHESGSDRSFGDTDNFHDAGTWSEDEDGNVIRAVI